MSSPLAGVAAPRQAREEGRDGLRALRALPLEQQVRRLPEWQRVRTEWRQAAELASP